MSTARQDRAQDESGAVLILALIFLVAMSLIVVGLLTLVGNSLNVTSSFASDRSVESAATSAMNLAIQNTRTRLQSQFLNASPPQPCWYDSGRYPLAATALRRPADRRVVFHGVAAVLRRHPDHYVLGVSQALEHPARGRTGLVRRRADAAGNRHLR